jgi:hypothetical protein
MVIVGIAREKGNVVKSSFDASYRKRMKVKGQSFKVQAGFRIISLIS